VESRLPTEIDTTDCENGPRSAGGVCPCAASSSTKGVGGDVRSTMPSTFTDSANALPDTSVTSARAELAKAVEQIIAEKQAIDR
jgi:hypothetical protein